MMLNPQRETVLAEETRSANHNRQYRCRAFGQTFHFPYFAGMTYRNRRAYTLQWSGNLADPVTVVKYR